MEAFLFYKSSEHLFQSFFKYLYNWKLGFSYLYATKREGKSCTVSEIKVANVIQIQLKLLQIRKYGCVLYFVTYRVNRDNENNKFIQ